jgi:hypothetical protein
LFTIAGEASASDSLANPFSAGVGVIAATASTAAAKRTIARPPGGKFLPQAARHESWPLLAARTFR